MMLLDAVIALLLMATVGYCWRLNQRISGFRNAKAELEHMIRSFDASIRQAYESIAVLKENSSDKNIQLIRDMEKVRFLANDLAYLVEKGEKLADSLESSVRHHNQERIPAVAASAPVVKVSRPVIKPARPAMPPQPQQAQPRIAEVQQMIDTLARSYVAPEQKAANTQQTPPSLPPRNNARPLASLVQPSTPEQRAEAIEKVLNHMAAKNARQESSMPSVAPREITQKLITPKPAVAAAGKSTNPFFNSLRVITPDE
jgi:hypothetical protein